MLDELAEILAEVGSAWEADSMETLRTCCGDLVEHDCPRCPSCGAENPLRALGII